MAQPKGVVQLADPLLAFGPKRLRIGSREGDDIPVLLIGQVVGDHVRPFALHGEADEAVRGPNLQHALAADAHIPEVGAQPRPQIPLAGLESIPGNIRRLVEVAIAEVAYHPRGRIDGLLPHRDHEPSLSTGPAVGHETSSYRTLGRRPMRRPRPGHRDECPIAWPPTTR